jgi:hypothetical protein
MQWAQYGLGGLEGDDCSRLMLGGGHEGAMRMGDV